MEDLKVGDYVLTCDWCQRKEPNTLGTVTRLTSTGALVNIWRWGSASVALCIDYNEIIKLSAEEVVLHMLGE